MRGTSSSRSDVIPFAEEINAFLRAAHEQGVRLLLVGGGAVNFHGYQRQSADVDLWIEPTRENFDRLLIALNTLGYAVERLPEAVLHSEQNISIKASPDMDLELITRFDPGCSFEEAWSRRVSAELAGEPVSRFHVLHRDDLIASKLRAGRPRDLLDVQELQRRGSRS